jgi:hypothetical protein
VFGFNYSRAKNKLLNSRYTNIKIYLIFELFFLNTKAFAHFLHWSNRVKTLVSQNKNNQFLSIYLKKPIASNNMQKALDSSTKILFTGNINRLTILIKALVKN